MEYILIDDESMRSIINKNAAGETQYTATSTFPLNIGGIYAPIILETVSAGGSDPSVIRFKVMVDYKTSFKLTFKEGFTIVRSDGVKLYTTEDVSYMVGATAGDISKVSGLDISDTLQIDDWGNAESSAYTYIMVTNRGVSLEAKEGLRQYWNDHADSAVANEDCDIMEYIYINGVSARYCAAR